MHDVVTPDATTAPAPQPEAAVSDRLDDLARERQSCIVQLQRLVESPHQPDDVAALLNQIEQINQSIMQAASDAAYPQAAPQL